MPEQQTLGRRLWELAQVFLKIGTIGFGGPAVTIAMMEDEVVTRRGWISRAYFLDLIGFTNLIPGPNALEMALHLGLLRAGWAGYWLAGAGFILPATATTLAFAWAYVRFGALPQVAPFLVGIQPAVLAVLVAALWRLGKAAFKGPQLILIGLAVLAGSLLGVHEIALLFGGGILGMLWLRAADLRRDQGAGGLAWLGPGLHWARAHAPATGRELAQGGLAWLSTLAQRLGAGQAPSIWDIFWFFFLRVGAVLYGSGYVLVAFMEGGLVRELGWLSHPQMLDAIAAGQFTPGPLLSAATFAGYLLRGVPGAVVATVGVFLPSFIFVAALSRVVPRLRGSPWAGAFLDTVNVSSLGLMAGVALKVGTVTLRDWRTMLIAVVAAMLALRYKANSAALVLGGALAGWLLSLVH